MKPKVISMHICTDNPTKLGTFYQQVLQAEPVWRSDDVIGFVLGEFRLEVMRHSDVSGTNPQPARLFFDLQVDDVRYWSFGFAINMGDLCRVVLCA